MSTTAKITRTTSQNLVKQGRKLDLENYCAPGVRDLWMPTFILMLNLATILLGIYRLDKVGFCQVDWGPITRACQEVSTSRECATRLRVTGVAFAAAQPVKRTVE